jgi:type VI protein secretion system component VasK
VEFAIVLGLVVLVFLAAGVVVTWQDRRAARRKAHQRAAALARLGEVDPLAPRRLADRLDG